MPSQSQLTGDSDAANQVRTLSRSGVNDLVGDAHGGTGLEDKSDHHLKHRSKMQLSLTYIFIVGCVTDVSWSRTPKRKKKSFKRETVEFAMSDQYFLHDVEH